MSLGRVAIGLASIALGLKHLSSGVRELNAVPVTRPFLPKGSRKFPGQVSARKSEPFQRQVRPGERVRTPSGSMRLRTYQIRNLDQRISRLRDLVQEGMRDPVVYEFARRAVNKKCGTKWCVPEKDNFAEGKALFRAHRDNVRYTSDIDRIDTYQSPRHTLRLRTGDCDDFSVLACASAKSLGIPCRFKVIKTHGAREWNHIYAQLGFPRRNPTRWVSFDASVNMPFGWEPPARMVAATRLFPT